MKTKKPLAEKTLPDHWKIRIFIRGAGLIHVASRTEPNVMRGVDGRLLGIEADYLPDPSATDKVAEIDWNEVSAISWRFCPADKPERLSLIV